MRYLAVLAATVCFAAAPPPQINIDNVNNTSLADVVNAQSIGDGVLRAQILLDRAHFSPGEIDGAYGDNLGRAIAAYRSANGLPDSPDIDAAMWAKLNQDTAPAIQQYTLQAEDVAGPYTPDIPQDMMAQAKLPALDYENPQEGLGEKFHCTPELLQTLNPGKDLTKAGTQIMAPNVIVPAPAGHVAKVVVSKNRGVVEAIGEAGKVIASYPATMGSTHDPLPIGDWQITEIVHNPYFHYNSNLFWDAKNKDEKATLKPGPNSPVGLVWMQLSKEHYGIHGTENPHTIGHTASHGCIRLTNWDAVELSNMIQKGVPVVCQED